jgi:hypothetical protein
MVNRSLNARVTRRCSLSQEREELQSSGIEWWTMSSVSVALGHRMAHDGPGEGPIYVGRFRD